MEETFNKYWVSRFCPSAFESQQQQQQQSKPENSRSSTAMTTISKLCSLVARAILSLNLAHTAWYICHWVVIPLQYTLIIWLHGCKKTILRNAKIKINRQATPRIPRVSMLLLRTNWEFLMKSSEQDENWVEQNQHIFLSNSYTTHTTPPSYLI